MTQTLKRPSWLGRHSLFMLIVFLFQACAVAQPAVEKGVPALQVIAPNGATNVLIGSLHIPADGLRQPAASVMNNVKHYLVEHVPENPPVKSPLEVEMAPEVLRLATQRAHWAEPLSDAQIAGLRRNVRCNVAGLPNSELDNFLKYLLMLKSAAVASGLAISPCASLGLLSRDTLLERAAKKQDIPIHPLETQAQIIKQRMAVPEEIYQHALFKAFTSESRNGLRRTVDALNSGAYEEILVALDDLAKSPADAKIYYRLMVADRNHAWIPVLRKYLDQGDAVVNVGSAHLPGPEGLIAFASVGTR